MAGPAHWSRQPQMINLDQRISMPGLFFRQKKKKKPAGPFGPAGKLRGQPGISLEFILETCLNTVHVTIFTVFNFTVSPDIFDTHVDTGNRTPDQVGMN